jgi:hypothetical protein
MTLWRVVGWTFRRGLGRGAMKGATSMRLPGICFERD